MMHFRLEDVRKLSGLSRLELSASEEQRIAEELSGVLAYIDQLKTLDVEQAKAVSHSMPVPLVCRDDVVQSMVGREGLLQSEGYENGLIRVPKVIE